MVISSFGVVWGSETEFTLGLRAVVYVPIIEFSLGLHALKQYVNYVYAKCKPTNFVKCKPGVNFVFPVGVNLGHTLCKLAIFIVRSCLIFGDLLYFKAWEISGSSIPSLFFDKFKAFER